MTPLLFIARAALAWTKNNRSLRNGKHKANRASETEEQRIERMRIGREKDRYKRNRKSSETEDHEKQRLATLKRLKQGDENELERKLKLEKVVTNKHLRLAVEKEEERTARLENVAATKRLSLAM